MRLLPRLRHRFRIVVEVAFQARHHQRAEAVAQHVHGRAGHVENAVDARDQGHAFQGHAHLHENDAHHDQARAGNAHGAHGGENGHQNDGQLRVQRQRDAVEFRHKNRVDAHVQGGAVHVDGVAQRDAEADHGARCAQRLGAAHVRRQGGRAGAGGEADHEGLQHALDEAHHRNLDHELDQRQEHETVQNGATGVHQQNDLAQGQQHGKAVLGHGVGHEAEDADGRIVHHKARYLDHDFAAGVEETVQMPSALTQGTDAEAENNGEDDDLEHIAPGHGFHRVDRDQVHQRVVEGRRGHRLDVQIVGGEVHARARLHDVGQQQAHGHGHRRGDQVVKQGLGGHAPQFGGVADARRARHQGGEDQRNHHHADQADENVAEKFEDGAAQRPVLRDHAHKHARNHADAHLHGQAHFDLCHTIPHQ